MTLQELGAVRRALDAGELDERLAQLRYGETEKARAKVRNVLEGFERSFGADDKRPVALCSAPGRTEICGNHTDHQHGRVLAGAVDLDFLACAAKNGTNRIRFQSEGWPMVEVELDELIPKAAERESTAALVRGMAGLVKERGYEVGGFDVYAASEVLPGSGLSSSAACEAVSYTHLIIPGTTLIITQYQLATFLKLTNKLFGLVPFYVAWVIPFSTFMIKGYIESIPRDYDEAVYMDGGSVFTVFFKVICPLASPAIASVSIFNFLTAWEEFPWAMTVINDNAKRTLPIAISGFFGQHQFTQWGYVFAMSVASLVPVLIVFVCCQKYFVSGLQAGGIKG